MTIFYFHYIHATLTIFQKILKCCIEVKWFKTNVVCRKFDVICETWFISCHCAVKKKPGTWMSNVEFWEDGCSGVHSFRNELSEKSIKIRVITGELRAYSCKLQRSEMNNIMSNPKIINSVHCYWQEQLWNCFIHYVTKQLKY